MKKSFTLIELIVVIAIIAILAAIIAPNAFKAIEKAKISQAIGDHKTYKTAVYAHYADTGIWPIVGTGPFDPLTGLANSWIRITDNGFMTNVKSLSGWDGPYLERVVNAHPWAGINGLDCVNRGQGADCDIGLFMDDRCEATGVNLECAVPHNSAVKIDETVDDGNTSVGSGNVMLLAGGTEVYWIIIWDAGLTAQSVLP